MAKKKEFNPRDFYEETKRIGQSKGIEIPDFETFENDLKNNLRQQGYNLGEKIDYKNEMLREGKLPFNSGQEYLEASKNRIDTTPLPNIFERLWAGGTSILGNTAASPFVLWDTGVQATSDWVDTNNPYKNKNYKEFMESRNDEYTLRGKLEDIEHEENYDPGADAFTGEQRFLPKNIVDANKNQKDEESALWPYGKPEGIVVPSKKEIVEEYNPNSLDYSNYSNTRYEKPVEKSENDLKREELEKNIKLQEKITNENSVKNVVDFDGKLSGYLMGNAQKDKERALLGLDGFERFLGETIFAAGDMLPTVALTAALGPAAGAGYMGAKSASNQMYDATEAGAYADEAFKSGVSTGIIETATEKISLGNLDDILKGNKGSAWRNILSQFVTEGVEEGTSYTAQTVANKGILGDKADDFSAAEFLNSVAIGGLVGGFYGGVGSIGNKGNKSQKYDELSNSSNRLLNAYAEIEKNEVSPEQVIETLPTEDIIMIDEVTRLEQERAEVAELYRTTSHEKRAPLAARLAKLDSNINHALNATKEIPSTKDIKAKAEEEYSIVYQRINELTTEKLNSNDNARKSEISQEVESLSRNKKELAKVINMNDQQIQSEMNNRLYKINEVEKQMILNIADKLRLNVDFKATNEMPNNSEGYYSNGSITMANETYNEPLKVFSHELTHFAENSGFYDKYASAAKSLIARNGQDYDYIKHQIIKDYANNGIELSDIDADKEVVAQFTQDLIRNEEDLKALVKYDRNLAQRVYDWIKMQLSKFTEDVDLINARNILSKALNTTDSHQNNKVQYSSNLREDGSRKDLQVLHNLNENNLSKSLKLDGLVMPSLAVTKDNLTHEEFGDISLVLNKDSVDPTNKENRVYSKDAWSPMFPDVDVLFDFESMRNELSSMTDKKQEIAEFISNFENYEYGITERSLEFLKKDATNNEMLNEVYSKSNTDNSFDEWLDIFLDKHLLQKGIHNGKDTYTNNGRRTFKQLHNDFTVDNVLKDMKKQKQEGRSSVFASSNSMAAKFAKKFKSLDEIISNRDLLADVTENDFAVVANEKLNHISRSLSNPNAENSYIESQRIVDLINDLAKDNLSVQEVKEYMNTYNVKAGDDQAQEILDYYDFLKTKSNSYFEAKPRRVVKFEEVNTAVIPSNTSQELKQKLQDKGIKVMEYNADIEEDRHNIISSLDETKFSIGKNYFSKNADGKETYVLKVPNSMFLDAEGKPIPMNARKKILRRFLLDNYRGKLINIGDLYDAKFTKETTNELSYKKSNNINVKNEIVADIEPILKNAEYIETVEDYGHHPEAIDGWDYFKLHFGIEYADNVESYTAKLSIMNSKKGPIIYEINEIKKDSTYEQSSIEPVVSGAIAKYSLGQNDKIVNTKNTLNRDVVNYDYTKRKLVEDIVAEGDAISFDNTIDELSIKALRNEDTSQLKRKIIDEALYGAKLKDRTINQRAKDVRKYINGYKDKTFYVNSNVAEELGYDNFTELNKDLGPINLSINKGNKYTGNHYSAFETLYKEVSEQFGFDSTLDEASSVELIKQAVKLNDDKINLADVLGEDNFKRHLERSLDEFEQRIKNSKLGDKERLERKSGKMELDPTFIQNYQYAKDLPSQTDDDIEMFANYGFNKSSKLKTLDQNILDIAGNDKNILQSLKRTIMDPLQKAKALNNERKIKAYKRVQNIISDFGIEAGSKESAAVMWLGERKRRVPIGKHFGKTRYATDLTNYNIDMLKKDFPSNWENIVKAEREVRAIYDQYIDDINDMLAGIYSEESLKEEVSKQRNQIKDEIEYNEYKLDNAKNPVEQKKYEDKISKLSRSFNKVSDNVYKNKRLIPRKDYFIHFNEIMLSDNLKDILGMSDLTEVQERKGAANIPNELASISEFTKPKARWTTFLQHRSKKSNNYVEDAIGGLLRYINLAEYKIAYDPYVDYMRSVNKKLINTSNEANVKNEHIIKYLSDFTDSISGKRLDTDRSILGQIKEKKTYKIIKMINQRMKANAVLMNFNSAVSQLYNLPNAQIVLAKNAGKGYLKDVATGTKLYGEDIKNGYGVIDQSVFMTERYIDTIADDLGKQSKANKVASGLLSFGDKVVAKQVWYSAYAQAQRLNVDNPIDYADTITRQAVAGRGVGEVPLWFNSELGKFVTPFQVEVANSFYTISDAAKKALRLDKNALKGLMSAALMSFLMNLVNKELTGRDVGMDPIGIAIDAIQNGDNVIGRLAGNVIENMPGGSYVASLMGGNDFSKETFFGDNDPSRYGTGLVGLSQLTQLGMDALSGNDINWQGLASLAFPMGGKQIERTYKAAEDMGFIPKVDFNIKEGFKVKDDPGAYTGSDKLKYVVDTSDPINVMKGLVFGSTATNEGKKYSEDGKTISEKRTEHALSGGFLNSDFSNAARSLKSENLKDSSGEGVRNSRAAMNREILLENDVWYDLVNYYHQSDDDTKKSIVSSYNLTNEVIGMGDNEFKQFVKTLESYK